MINYKPHISAPAGAKFLDGIKQKTGIQGNLWQPYKKMAVLRFKQNDKSKAIGHNPHKTTPVGTKPLENISIFYAVSREIDGNPYKKMAVLRFTESRMSTVIGHNPSKTAPAVAATQESTE